MREGRSKDARMRTGSVTKGKEGERLVAQIPPAHVFFSGGQRKLLFTGAVSDDREAGATYYTY